MYHEPKPAQACFACLPGPLKRGTRLSKAELTLTVTLRVNSRHDGINVALRISEICRMKLNEI